MAIAFRSSSLVTFTVAASASIPLPSGHVAGDLLLCHMQFSAGTGITPPAGWTEITTFYGDTPQSGYRLFWKLDGGSETDPAVWTGTSLSGGATMVAYSGVDATTPIEMAAAGIISGSGAVEYPAAVARSNNALYVATYSRINNTTATTFGAPPAPTTSRQIGAGTLIAGSSYYTSVVSDAPMATHHVAVDPGNHGAVVSSNRTVMVVVLRASGETDYGTFARVSQLVEEVLLSGDPETRVSQIVIEVLQSQDTPVLAHPYVIMVGD